MAHYVDGYVLPVAKDKLDVYRKIARKAGKIWREHGALEYRECVGDDLDVKELLSFPRLTKAKENETVIFAWIVFKSKKDRDRINAKVMQDPRMNEMGGVSEMPFDCKKMAYGGFKTIVEE